MHSFNFPIGVHSLHSNTGFDFQLNRLAGLGGGDLEEIREAAQQIGDLNDWKREFLALGERAMAEKRLQHAAAYLRAAEFNMVPGDPDKAKAYEQQASLFEDLYADDVATGRLRKEQVIYEGGHLPVWNIAVPDDQASKGIIIVHGGFDSYGEELYPFARALADAGYEAVLFEGPGQGSVIRRQGIHFTAEWERPVKAVLDHFDFDDVTLVGISLGGYLATRAAAFEPRVRRVVAFGVMWDFFEVVSSKLPIAARILQRTLSALGAKSLLDKGIRRRMEDDPLIKWAIEHGCYVFGVESPAEYFNKMRHFTTRDISSKINQDFLLLAGNGDHYVPIEHYHKQAQALTNVRSFTGRIFTAQESAQSHCQVGNVGLALRVILDWVDERSNA